MEKSVATINDEKNKVFDKVVGRHAKGKAQ